MKAKEQKMYLVEQFFPIVEFNPGKEVEIKDEGEWIVTGFTFNRITAIKECNRANWQGCNKQEIKRVVEV